MEGEYSLRTESQALQPKAGHVIMGRFLLTVYGVLTIKFVLLKFLYWYDDI